MTYLARIAAEIITTPLFLDARKAATIAAVLGDRIGIDGDLDAFARSAGAPLATRAPAQGQAGRGYQKIGGGIAVVGMVGSLVTRTGGMDAQSGLISYSALTAAMRAANADGEVSSIILDIHSPGGSATGAIEAADIVSAVARKKPVVAIANSLCCSAAYLIAAAANKIVATKTASVGSVGVVLLHLDRSKQLAGKGIAPTFVFAGKHKVAGNELEALSDEVTADLQAEVNQFFDMMVDSIAGHRPKLTAKAIRATEARVYLGEEAVSLGLADEIGTFDSVVGQLAALDPVVRRTKYDVTEATFGELSANAERLQDAHRAGVRAGLAAATAGKT